ncbi:hypothetical protein AB1Y20_009425 [Prymnesium parvum]|uniref:Tetratricopeptide repeat protein 5 OB fold domain-containing protein n=1 Tax=Prymnesium parvum TaxID=97485 RepID=A0AB34K0A0_PRYPA
MAWAPAHRAVDAAYELHDTLYASSEAERDERMRQAQARALAAVDACEAAAEAEGGGAKARLSYLRGKALASTAAGRDSEEAERLLADAVKLQPSLNDAWNCLGECYWSRGEHEMARYTFLTALEHGRTADTLYHLSMLQRMIGRPGASTETVLQESVQLAKEAVRLDASSARTWCGLGNAHLTLYARASSSAEDLRMAHRAFLQADKARTEAGGPDHDADMHVNHGTVCSLLGLFAEAIAHFSQAHALDPTIGALLKQQQTWAHVARLSELIATKAGLKPKKFSSLVDELPAASLPLSKLQLGQNPGKAPHVVVIYVMPQDKARCHPCVVVSDREGQCVALLVFPSRGATLQLQVGDAIEVVDPTLCRVEVEHPEAASVRAGFHLISASAAITPLRAHRP